MRSIVGLFSLAALVATPLVAQTPPQQETALRAHVEFLADDAMLGRDSFTPEYRIAANYVATQLMAAGVQPGGDDGGYLQNVGFQATIPSVQGEMAITRRGKRQALAFGEDFVGAVNPQVADFRLRGDVVFAGYGAVDPDIGWDDYRGLNVRGKIVAVLAGGPARLASEKRAHFSGRASKSQAALARGAKGIVLIDSIADDAGYSVADRAANWQRPSISWVAPDGRPNLEAGDAPSIGTLSRAGAAKLFAGAPIRWAAVDAAERSGAAMPTGRLGASIEARQRSETAALESANVVGVIPGSDPKLAREQVVLTAHLDHLGVEEMTEDDPKADRINNGAIDNAIGIAMMLEVAREFQRSGKRPRRTIVFTAVTAEEVGLLGSEYYAQHPSVAGTMVANINLDMPIMTYPFRDIIAYGAERSSIGATLKRILDAEGLPLTPDPVPEENYFVRSDHYSFVKAGVPSIYLDAGPAGPGKAATDAFVNNHYHQVSDQTDLPIDWTAARRFMAIHYRLARDIADADARPRWTRGDFFGVLFGGYGAK
jgi:Zn-dependent M28 family amino/carboxypeptidase